MSIIHFLTDSGEKFDTSREPPASEAVAPLQASALAERARSTVEFLYRETPRFYVTGNRSRLPVQTLTLWISLQNLELYAGQEHVYKRPVRDLAQLNGATGGSLG